MNVARAADWYGQNKDNCPRPVVPFLKNRFGLTAREVWKVFKLVRDQQTVGSIENEKTP